MKNRKVMRCKAMQEMKPVKEGIVREIYDY